MSTVRAKKIEEAASELDYNIYLNEKRDEVFRNDMLREIILDYLIQKSSIFPAYICSLRLVQKAWLRDVTRLALKYNLPFADLQLTAENSLNESEYVRETGQTLLDHFVATMEHSVDSFTFPFRLEISEAFFCHENQQSFLRFLTSSVCASGMLRLNMHVPPNGGAMTFLLPAETVSFSGLKSLQVTFCAPRGIPVVNQASINIGSNFVPFLQFILNNTTALANFSVCSTGVAVVPAETKCLSLPATFTELSVDALLNDEKMEILVRNSFPNLVSLTLGIGGNPLSADDPIYQILDSTKTTLRHLKLISPSAGYHFVSEEQVKYLRFPLMKCLETCKITSYYLEVLGSQLNLPLPDLLPKLKELILSIHTEDSLRKWTGNWCFQNVTSVEIVWLPIKVYLQPSNVFNEKDMEGVHKALPNLTQFSFRCKSSSCIAREAVLYLFENLSKLRVLRLELVECDFTGTQYWDSLFCGIPLEAASQLSAQSDLWDEKTNFNLASIRNLTSLRDLTLGTMTADADPLEPLITGLTFEHAFKKMPHLETISLFGKFRPLEKITTLDSTHMNLQDYGKMYFSSKLFQLQLRLGRLRSMFFY